MMKTENLEKIRNLRRNANAFKSFFGEWKAVTADPSVDKKSIGFNKDNRFTVFSHTIFFEAHKGYYGNSGCHTFSNGIDSKLVPEYFVRALEKNRETIFADIAAMMLADAVNLTVEAEKEVAALNAMLDEVKAAGEQEAA